MNYFFSYTIRYYEEIANKEEVASGIVYGNSLVEAIEKIADYYDDEKIVRILDFQCLTDTPVLECKDAEFRFPAHFECDPSVE